MPLSPTSRGKKALLLGMVYSEEHEPKRGQEFRDRVRCESLEQHCGYDVFTLDDKHDDQSCCVAGRHCKANFADARRMNASIHNKFGYDISFDIIILDYFFSPVRCPLLRDHIYPFSSPTSCLCTGTSFAGRMGEGALDRQLLPRHHSSFGQDKYPSRGGATY